MTADPRKSVEVIVEDGDVEDLEIMLSADTYPHSIRGMVTDADGRPLEDIELWAKRRGEWLYNSKTGSDGRFDIIVLSGEYVLDVLVRRGSTWSDVGSYDGAGITQNDHEAYKIVVEDQDVEGLEIVLSTDS